MSSDFIYSSNQNENPQIEKARDHDEKGDKRHHFYILGAFFFIWNFLKLKLAKNC